MLIWLGLSIIIVGISFILAYQSMRDYYQKPSELGKDYAIFLIRNPSAVSLNLIGDLYKSSRKTDKIIALERLFKGSRSAAVIFGPKSILKNYPDLNLLELEDYSLNVSKYVAWEVGSKDEAKLHLDLPDVFRQVPALSEKEQFWWQLILHAKSGKPIFHCQIRAVVVAPDENRLKELSEQLESFGRGQLLKVPKAFTNEQILKMYTQRAKQVTEFNSISLTPEEALRLFLKT